MKKLISGLGLLLIAFIAFNFSSCKKCKDDCPEPGCLYSADLADWKSERIPNPPGYYTSVTHKENDIRFWLRFYNSIDTSMMGWKTVEVGSINIPHGGWDTTANSNFKGNIVVMSNTMLKVDFSQLKDVDDKVVQFDVNFDKAHWDSIPNPFQVNGESRQKLPTGITYQFDQLNNGCHVTIKGEIDFIEWYSWETAFDNLCVTKND